LKKNAQGDIVVDVYAGGGLGRTLLLASLIKSDLPWAKLPSYLSAVLRVYNRFGRRDNIYKARIKILVKALGPAEFARQVEAQWQDWDNTDEDFLPAEWQRVAKHFSAPNYASLNNLETSQQINLAPFEQHKAFARWLSRNVKPHKVSGYASVILSLKPHATSAPGDATSAQMRLAAGLADEFSFGEIRVTHEQNLVLADVEQTASV
jgi:sulfite reductase (NADPH) hemoprotein beta-component